MDQADQTAPGQVTHESSHCDRGGRLVPARLILIGAAITALVGLFAFWWLCRRSESVSFLATTPGAEWIVYPTPIEGATHRASPLSTEFQRSLNLATSPAKATLTIRACRSATIVINGKIILLAPAET